MDAPFTSSWLRERHFSKTREPVGIARRINATRDRFTSRSVLGYEEERINFMLLKAVYRCLSDEDSRKN